MLSLRVLGASGPVSRGPNPFPEREILARGIVGAMLDWESKDFDALSPRELYEALALRANVFVVEQTCVYLDCDGKDLHAMHLFGRTKDGKLVAYARLLPPGKSFGETSIGRVVTCPSVRRTGLGEELVREAIARASKAYGAPIRIGAQRYLEAFYARLGFEAEGEPYDEDGISHVEMVLPAR